MLLIAKNALLACFWVILDKSFLLNGKLLGYKNPFSMNYWVSYLENRNHLIEHFAPIRNHLIEHFALFRSYKSEHFRALIAKHTL